MNGPLTRLLGRSSAPLPGLRPRPAARYEHRPADGAVDASPPAIAGEPDEATLEQPAAQAGAPRETAAAGKTGAGEPGDTVALAERGERPTPSSSGAGDHCAVVRQEVAGRQQMSAAPVAVTVAAVSPSPAAAAPPRQGEGASPEVVPEPAPVTVVPEHPRLRVGTVPTVPATAPESDANTVAGEAEPTVVVEVSIGRLDIRTPPATPAPRPPSAGARENHAKVLESYLRRRARGELG
ncbi:hypothetical protein ACGFNV_00395 [Streptomyces sp. NPDC048751]|uniref:hypothetical protein n=1 Tax=Streptomyces sp. NPDC048751 TaxID=3365591 RepID=UPI00371F8E40